jgi:lysophospholipase
MSSAVSHLVLVAENPMPPGGEVAVLRTSDGVELRMAFWRHAESRGTVCVFPGRSEFIEKYFETIGELQARGFSVAALDWRGQGGSSRELPDPKKGHVDDFDLYLRDLDALLSHLAAADAPRPWFGLAHSMGGAILLLANARGETRLRRLVLTAPMMGLFGPGAAATARHIVQAANVAGLGAMYVPGSGSRSPSGFAPFEGNPLTSDPLRYQRQGAIMIAGNEVTIGSPTIAWLAAAYRLMQAMQAPDFGLQMSMPSLVVAAGADTIVSTTMVETLCARMRGAHSTTIVGAKHEILMERDPIRAQFWAAFDAFIPGT